MTTYSHSDLQARADVLSLVGAYLHLLNNLALKPERYHYTVEPSGKNYRIILCHTESNSQDRSVHSFVDGNTGDVLKAAGWKVPTKGVRYNLFTDLDMLRNKADWAGSYLYIDQVKANHKQVSA